MSEQKQEIQTKTPEDFAKAVAKKNITEWQLRTCSICEAPVYYRFMDNKVFFDSNCDCATYTTPLHSHMWKNLSDHYNRQTNEAVIKSMDEFFGFKN